MLERVVRVVQSFVGGAVIATVITVVHAESFPWVLAGGLAVVSLYLIGLRLVAEDRLIAVAGSIGVVLTVLILAQRSAGGSVLIAANDAGNVWVIGVSLIAGLTAAWPKLPSRPAR